MPKTSQPSMLKKNWSKLESLVNSSSRSKYRDKVVEGLSHLERAFAEWLFVSQVETMVPNTVKVKLGPTVVQTTVEKELQRLKTILPNSGSKMQEYHDRLDSLQSMPKEKKVIESMKSAAKRVDKEWELAKKAFFSILSKAAVPSVVLEARKLVGNTTKLLSFKKSKKSKSDQNNTMRVPWEGGELTSWPVEKARLLEDEARLVDLVHSALREVASSNYHSGMISAVAEKYGLPTADMQWLSSVLVKNKTPKPAPSPSKIEDEVEIPTHPSEHNDVDHDQRAKVVWESIMGRVPRAVHHYLKSFEVRYEVGTLFPPIPEEGPKRKEDVNRFYLGKEHRKHFFSQGKDEPAVDMRNNVIYLPPTAALWSVEDMTSKLVSKAVDIFLQRSRLLTKGDLEKHISKFFLTEQDIDKLISSLNELSLESEPSEDIRGLEDQMKKHYPEPDKAQKFHEWWAENQGHFTRMLKDKRMVPLFHKWLAEILMSMITTSPSPKDVPYPVAEFITKLSSLTRFRSVISRRILNVRTALMQEPGTEDVLKELREAADNVV